MRQELDRSGHQQGRRQPPNGSQKRDFAGSSLQHHLPEKEGLQQEDVESGGMQRP